MRQKLRSLELERRKEALEEIIKPKELGVIKEVQYPKWMANIVMVKKKKTGGWGLYIDLSNLNVAFPKDSYPLPNIDILIDKRSSGFELLVLWMHILGITRSI